MEKQKCLECSEPFLGRVDKKFCSDYCRNAHHNKINKDSNNLLRNTNNRLRKNWRILEELNPKDKRKVTKQLLEERGFDFNFFTNTNATNTGDVYYFCYDQGYLVLENDYYALVKRE